MEVLSLIGVTVVVLSMFAFIFRLNEELAEYKKGPCDGEKYADYIYELIFESIMEAIPETFAKCYAMICFMPFVIVGSPVFIYHIFKNRKVQKSE